MQTESLASLCIRSPETNPDSDPFVWRTLRVRVAQGHFVTDSKLSATSFDKDDLSNCKTTLSFVSENGMTRKRIALIMPENACLCDFTDTAWKL